MDTPSILHCVADHGVKLIRAIYAGPDGVIRGKAVTPGGLEALLASGAGLTQAQLSVTVLDMLPPESEFQPIGEVRIMPDPLTFEVLPYLPGHARMLSDLETQDGQPWEMCPRSLLKSLESQLADRGWTLRAAFENEFTLHDERDGQWVPYASANCFASSAMDEASGFVLAAIDALAAQGIEVEKFFPEAGPGQLELPVRHASLLDAADRQVVFRETIRGVATAQGRRVSFMPKASPDAAGNGCHIHFSLWDEEERNLWFDAAQPYELAEAAQPFLAGVLDHLDAVMAFTAPTVNSYRRFVERCWSSCYRTWGPDNREATLRVASAFRHDRSGTVNVELKPSDPTCNPYLALAALVVAGLDGIDRGAKLPPAMLTDPALLSAKERTKLRAESYPADLAAAVAALEKDEVFVSAFGAARIQDYCTMKRAEIEALAALGPDGERMAYEFRF